MDRLCDNVMKEKMFKEIMEKERKVGKMVGIVSASFFLLYFPLIILRAINPNAMIETPHSYILCMLLSCSVTIVDPVVYIIFQEKYRKAIEELLKSACVCYSRKSKSSRSSGGLPKVWFGLSEH